MRDARALRARIAQAAMDKAYDRHAMRAQLAATGLEPVIPPTAHRVDAMCYDKAPEQLRHQVERLCNKRKQGRSVATRSATLPAMCLGCVILALIGIMLR